MSASTSISLSKLMKRNSLSASSCLWKADCHLADSFGDASGDLRAAARVDLRFQRGAGVEQLERRGEVIAQERAQLGEHIRLFLKPLQNLAAGCLDILNLSGKRRIGNRVVGGGQSDPTGRAPRG